ncbi:uncharacterized protein si:ch1073-15f19.2 [Betta splendens]|uniref:Uncharacterized protein si:ch1073-15f19.2 n=1 Tax=Betta splendens TaxID=158456 RepID=A0A6P7PTA8_BETSP|nr:uncharacterized protein si:ch1073-15f19.2 [Betta splendens]
MSLGSLNMAGTSLGALFSLLFLASITQGYKAVDLFCYESWPADVGQDVALPCSIKQRDDFKIDSIQWTKKMGKNENKLAVYSPMHGLHQFMTNVTIETMEDDANSWLGFPVRLSAVTVWDSGVYICGITTFPHGPLRCETELKIKDIDKITCDVNGTVEALSGENVTIRCAAIPNIQYRWTKNQNLVSDTESLNLWQVTEADTGTYTLTVNTGSKYLHEEFNITVLTVSLTTDLSTRSVVTTQAPTDSTVSSLGTTFQPSSTTGLQTTGPQTTGLQTTGLQTTGLQTNSTSVTWTRSLTSDVTDASTKVSNATNPPDEHKTPFTNNTHFITATANPPLNSTLRSSSAAFNRTHATTSGGMLNASATQPNNVTANAPEESSITDNPAAEHTTKPRVEGNERSHLLVLIMVPLLLLIAVVAFLIRRRVIKQRMDLPPSFKPPPPPVKYAAAVYQRREISATSYPVSRCNSLAECI